VHHTGRVSGDPHPGNYLLLADGRVGFLDFGLMRMVDGDYLAGEQALARAVVAGDARAVHRDLSELGFLPDPGAFDPERLLAQLRLAGEWYVEPGARRMSPAYVTDLIERGSSPRSEFFDDMRQMTLPPQALLIRRMEGLVFSTLGELRARGDWHALAREYFDDVSPSTALGEQDAAFWADGRLAARPMAA
jgi:predicted unusual protein kinase regulating ubiquinone biosynthesis (AarF/ABC1/UbiB family)